LRPRDNGCGAGFSSLRSRTESARHTDSLATTAIHSRRMHFSLGIIGSGRAAWAFAATWKRIGWPITGMATRGATWDIAPRKSVEDLAKVSDILLVAVSDRAIEDVVATIPDTDAIIVHP